MTISVSPISRMSPSIVAPIGRQSVIGSRYSLNRPDREYCNHYLQPIQEERVLNPQTPRKTEVARTDNKTGQHKGKYYLVTLEKEIVT